MFEDDSETQAWHTPERPSATRRDWIRSAGGGLLLAAGGLFLPEWLEEAAAREGAHSGQLGGRHGPNARGRDKRKRRDHGDKDRVRGNNDRPRGAAPKGSRGGLFPKAIYLYVYNDRSAPIEGSAYRARERGWVWVDNHSIPNGQYRSINFYPDNVGGLLMDRFFIKASNPSIGTPGVVLATGGIMSQGDYLHPSAVWSKELSEDEEVSTEMGGRHFRFKRLYDAGDFKYFDIHFM